MTDIRWVISAAGCGLALLMAPGSGEAQSIFSLLPTDGRTLSVGSEGTGALSADDPRGADDAPLEAWTLEGSVGERVIIDLQSEDFDAYLYLVGPGFEDTVSDDDSGGGCDARLDVTFLESGEFRVIASSLSSERGTYTLSVATEASPVPTYTCGDVNPARILDLPTEGRVLEFGGGVRSSLEGTEPTVQFGRPGQAWAYQGTAGERVTFRLISDDFDAYLYLFGPGMTDVLFDDDSAGELDAEITVTFPESGAYQVVASSLAEGAIGSYVIEAVEPMDLATLPTEGRIAVIGETVSGVLPTSGATLIDGRPGQAWALDAEAGQRLEIDLASEDFDTYLYVLEPGSTEPISDDDGGDDTNSRLALDVAEAGRHLIIVSPYSSGAGGAFELTVREN